MYEHNFDNQFKLGLNFANEDYSYLNGELPEDIPEDLSVERISVVGEYEYNNITNEYQYVDGFRSIFTYSFTLDSKGDNDLLRNFLSVVTILNTLNVLGVEVIGLTDCVWIMPQMIPHLLPHLH